MAFTIPRVSVGTAGRLGKISRLGWLVIAGSVVLLLGYNSCTTYVRPGEAGVKQSKFGKGIEPTIYGVGLHYVGVGETMHRFPNATVLYRIVDPLRVIQTIGLGRLFEDAAVIPRSAQDLRRALGELDAEDFYKGTKRMEKAHDAKVALAAELKDKGIEVVDVYVRRYIYDSRYQQAIEQRKIQDQTVYKNEAEAKAATAAALKNKIVAEGAAAVQVELSRGDAEMKKLEAQADLYRRQRAADGDLLVKLAEAQGTELENQALRGVGSENMVGLRMADALKNTKVIVLPTDGESGMNPLDLRALLRRFDVGVKP
ncbi:MAG: SPFH domain-containing protein [Deltaproteobacteria bacterium]|nr:MAG: SPFH domain-containing protein [Deltaproteobacteria bacterium]